MTTSAILPAGRTARAVALAAALALTGACGGGDDAATAAPGDTTSASTTEALPLALGSQDVATVTRRPIEPGLVLTGSLEPAERVPIVAQVSGTVDRVLVDRGSRVTRGQVLAVITADGIRASAAGAEAGVAAAQAALALAQQQLEAARTLFEAGAMSRIDYQAAQAQAKSAEAQLRAAEAQAASAGEMADRTTIRSPISGAISSRGVEAGQPVANGDPLFTVVDPSVLELMGQIPVEQASDIRPGQSAYFTLAGQPGEELKGTVNRVDPTADPSTRQVGIYVRLPNPGNRIVGGQFARGRVVSGRADTALVVPITALRGGLDSAYVLVVEQNRIARRQVTVGVRDAGGGYAAINQGLNEGETVVVLPGAALVPGTRVAIESPRSNRTEQR